MDMVNQFIKTIATSNIWLVQTVAVLLFAFIFDLITRKILKRIIAKAHTTKTLWDETLFLSLMAPVRLLIWFLAILFVLQVLEYHLPDVTFFDKLPTLAIVGSIVIITWFVYRFTYQAELIVIQKNAQKGNTDKTLVQATGRIIRISILIIALLMLLQTLGVSISGVLAFGGIGGLAVSFAAKDMLANFFGGLMLYLDRPFKIGEWIRSPDKNIEGVVEHMGWRLTQIRTFDKRLLFVPNSVFSTISVENPSRMTNRRIRTIIGLRYDDAPVLANIISDVEAMLKEHPDIDMNLTLMVRFVEYGPSSLNFLVYTFTKTTDWVMFQTVQQDVLFKILEIIEEHKAEVAFPTTTVHLFSQDQNPMLQGEN